MKNYFAQNLKYLRETKNLDQESFSEELTNFVKRKLIKDGNEENVNRVNYARSTISCWENNIRIPKMEDVLNVSDFFNVGTEIISEDLRNLEMTDDEEERWYKNLENQNVKIVFDKLHEKKNLTHEQAQYINKIIDAIVDEEDNNS